MYHICLPQKLFIVHSSVTVLTSVNTSLDMFVLCNLGIVQSRDCVMLSQSLKIAISRVCQHSVYAVCNFKIAPKFDVLTLA